MIKLKDALGSFADYDVFDIGENVMHPEHGTGEIMAMDLRVQVQLQ